jgi:hypothetical protein
MCKACLILGEKKYLFLGRGGIAPCPTLTTPMHTSQRAVCISENIIVNVGFFINSNSVTGKTFFNGIIGLSNIK